ncbi:MAG: hypothetical protein EOO65_01765 [Methanosarcinales archaeon]|nr:MAG: hypothetical protein EOO65_01765 [Methanosarcinales archaeon]
MHGCTLAGLPPLDTSNEISVWANVLHAVASGRVVLEANTLTLPAGLQWPATKSDKLFIRPCYSHLYDSVFQKLDRSKVTCGTSLRRIVTGQPGIGKSTFGYVRLTSRVHPTGKRFDMNPTHVALTAGGTSCTDC